MRTRGKHAHRRGLASGRPRQDPARYRPARLAGAVLAAGAVTALGLTLTREPPVRHPANARSQVTLLPGPSPTSGVRAGSSAPATGVAHPAGRRGRPATSAGPKAAALTGGRSPRPPAETPSAAPTQPPPPATSPTPSPRRPGPLPSLHLP